MRLLLILRQNALSLQRAGHIDSAAPETWAMWKMRNMRMLRQSSALQGPNAGFSKLMNRLLGVHVDMQRKIFDYFTALQVSPASELALSNDTSLLPDSITDLLLICRF